MLRAVGGRPGLRCLPVPYLAAASLWCQVSSVAGVTGKISGQRLRGRSRACAANHTHVSRVVPDPADVAAEHRVLVPEHQHLSRLRPGRRARVGEQPCETVQTWLVPGSARSLF
jgi:hypothetical protein